MRAASQLWTMARRVVLGAAALAAIGYGVAGLARPSCPVSGATAETEGPCLKIHQRELPGGARLASRRWHDPWAALTARPR